MSNPPSLTLVVDGITAQHAGELLFDSTITSRQRRECRETYITCLEDFTFALLFGSKFALSGSLSQVGKESPGLLLTDTFSELFHRLDIPGQQKPGDLLDRPAFQARIAFDLECLDKAFEVGKGYWKHWMIREATSYLGDHQSLFDVTTSTEQFVFGIKPPYFINRKLQDRIPTRFIDNLVSVIRSQGGLPPVIVPALREFVSRNALTLMTIDEWYDTVTKKVLGHDGLRVPHVIRSPVRQTQVKQQIEPNVREARTMITRLALADALSAPRVLTRKELITCLWDMRDEGPYPKIRNLLSELTAEISNAKREKEAAKLKGEIQRLLRTADTVSDKVQLDIGTWSFDPVTGGGKFKVFELSAPLLENISNLVSDFMQPTRRALRDLVVRASGAKGYYEKLAKVFPELGLAD